MASPKRKTSHSRKRMRSASKYLVCQNFVSCKNCGAHISPHTICYKCGMYKGNKYIS